MLPKISTEHLIAKKYLGYLTSLRNSAFSGEIKTDYAARLAVATDNSIYQVIPQAVLLPKTTEDIVIALQLSQRPEFHHVKFAPRGGGTATNGQSLTAGIIIDCSKYLRDILEINLAEQWVRVQPGVVLDQLNQYLRQFNLHFAPEISPSNRATIGGMINTDACGNGSKIIGRTSDHVLDLTCVLSNGTVIHSNQITQDDLQDALTDLLKQNQTLIHEKFFEAPRTLSGYNLAKSYQDKLNLTYLLCGAEGTLGIISECKLKLTPIPKFNKLLVIQYRNFEDALSAKEITSDIQPLVIETINEKLISLARQDSFYFQIKEFIEPADAINLVEFVGDNEQSIDEQIARLCTNIKNSHHAIGYYLAKNALEIKLLWNLRKKSVGLISQCKDGTRRPIAFIEDTAVPPEKLPAYIAEFKQLLDKHQLVYGMYGHVDAGCVHVRPALDMRLPQDEQLIRILSDEVVALVKRYGGVMWGEHGKGYRSEYGPVFFGDELYLVLRKIKTLFDPFNQLNPGKIATPLDSNDTVVNLESHMRGQFDKQILPDANAEFASAIACNGNGACFNFATQDVMCPSFKVTQDRIHSPKGRATVVREWLRQLAKKNYSFKSSDTSGNFLIKLFNRLGKKTDFSHEVFSALAGCLSCKACANQCPLSVDVPDFKSKFLAHYHRRYLRHLRDYFIAGTETIAVLQAKFPRCSNWLVQRKLVRFILRKLLRIVDPPQIIKSQSSNKSLGEGTAGNSLIIVQDVFTSFYEADILSACYNFFTAIGFSVRIVPFFKNGKPLHVKGFLKSFSRLARTNITYLQQLAALNIPIIGIDPSMTLTYRDEYQKLLGQQPLGFTVQLPQEFLHQHLNKLPSVVTDATYYLLSHCTEKTTQVETDQQWKSIFEMIGIKLIPLAAGCCGMAGSYGHEVEHALNSKKLFAMDWQKHVAETPDAKTFLLATGYSCRSQVNRFSGYRLQHPVEALLHIIKKVEEEHS